eukprot:TRINITY_DN84149_c0_g1_i1.p2 TRINITY_DN84149_c0_g1~~TRINITY_DN84149_c0_g1_i1.p2  ORF type:complete len:201 (-),score=11.86 TRINITY_DN84149_c0_g1_i1:40-642(-)
MEAGVGMTSKETVTVLPAPQVWSMPASSQVSQRVRYTRPLLDQLEAEIVAVQASEPGSSTPPQLEASRSASREASSSVSMAIWASLVQLGLAGLVEKFTSAETSMTVPSVPKSQVMVGKFRPKPPSTSAPLMSNVWVSTLPPAMAEPARTETAMLEIRVFIFNTLLKAIKWTDQATHKQPSHAAPRETTRSVPWRCGQDP